MEIHFNSSVDRVAGTPRPVAKPAEPAAVQTSSVDFAKSEALEQVMAQGEDMRPHIVEHANVLAAQASYPPEETIMRIANLLAGKIEP